MECARLCGHQVRRCDYFASLVLNGVRLEHCVGRCAPLVRSNASVLRCLRLELHIVPTAVAYVQIMQRMNEKPEKETGTRAELNKQFLKVTRNSKVSSQRSTKVDL